MADGGEGTVDAIVDALGRHIVVDVQDPLGRLTRASYGCVEHRRLAVMEIAAAAGLELVAPDQRDVQRDPGWQQDYRTYRPVVERKISHFTHRPWGGRKARCRGAARILTDIVTRASAINLARLATLGLHRAAEGWAIA